MLKCVCFRLPHPSETAANRSHQERRSAAIPAGRGRFPRVTRLGTVRRGQRQRGDGTAEHGAVCDQLVCAVAVLRVSQQGQEPQEIQEEEQLSRSATRILRAIPITTQTFKTLHKYYSTIGFFLVSSPLKLFKC